jgi:predicted lipoprotein
MKRLVIIFGGLFLCGVLFWFFPLFHIIHNETRRAVEPKTTFNAARFAETFWDEKLIPSLAHAPDAATLLSAPKEIRANYGRTVGISRTKLIILRGSGAIASIDKTGVGVSLVPGSKTANVLLQTGLIFGNTVRDATELLDVGTFPDSRQFNELSTELNRIVETRIIPTLTQKAAVGRTISFAGCGEITDDLDSANPLKIIPLEIRIE